MHVKESNSQSGSKTTTPPAWGGRIDREHIALKGLKFPDTRQVMSAIWDCYLELHRYPTRAELARWCTPGTDVIRCLRVLILMGKLQGDATGGYRFSEPLQLVADDPAYRPTPRQMIHQPHKPTPPAYNRALVLRALPPVPAAPDPLVMLRELALMLHSKDTCERRRAQDAINRIVSTLKKAG
jgi:hypothetical protein